jgi:hypothetical protein
MASSRPRYWKSSFAIDYDITIPKLPISHFIVPRVCDSASWLIEGRGGMG